MSAVAKPRLRTMPLAAGVTAALSLLVGLFSGPQGNSTPTLFLGALAGALLLGALLARGVEILRSGLAAWGVLGALMLAVIAALWWFLAVAYGELSAIGVLVAVAGVATIGVQLVSSRSAWNRSGGTPWQSLTGGPSPRAVAARSLQVWGPVLGGVFLVLLGLRVAYESLISISIGSESNLLALPLTATAFVALALVVWGVVRTSRGRASTPRTLDAPGQVVRDEQAVAAHLHDSVLQTLSLIQRNASDPARVAQLARQQERSLRAWLAGRDDAQGDTLAGAVRLIAQEVEDEQPGAVIEVVAVGDAPLDREADAMVRAAREAMRNAVRHAGSPVRVFVEVEDGVRELFVRDTGPGFDLGAVADERRGVRDAIIGRMEHVGGTATIDSTASGTEIALKLPAPSGGSR